MEFPFCRNFKEPFVSYASENLFSVCRGENRNIFARKLRHHKDILHSAGMKSAKRGKPKWLMDLSMLFDGFFFVLLTISRFFLPDSIFCCCFCSKRNSDCLQFIIIEFISFGLEWKWRIRSDKLQHHIEADLTTYQHDVSVVPHAKKRSVDRKIKFFSCLVIKKGRRWKQEMCIMWCSKSLTRNSSSHFGATDKSCKWRTRLRRCNFSMNDFTHSIESEIFKMRPHFWLPQKINKQTFKISIFFPHHTT